jgi:hypothetical protein
MVSAEGAGADRFNVRFWLADPVSVTVGELKLSVAPTLTVWTALLYPVALAVTVGEPKFTPVIWG